MKIDIGVGYRQLEPGEKVIEGDEFLSPIDGWVPSYNWTNGAVQIGLPYRRKVTPTTIVAPDGYRLLDHAEYLEPGDLELYKDCRKPSVVTWKSKLPVSYYLSYTSVAGYARKKTDTEETYRLLEIGEVLQVGDEERRVSSTAAWDEITNIKKGDKYMNPVYQVRRKVSRDHLRQTTDGIPDVAAFIAQPMGRKLTRLEAVAAGVIKDPYDPYGEHAVTGNAPSSLKLTDREKRRCGVNVPVEIQDQWGEEFEVWKK